MKPGGDEGVVRGPCALDAREHRRDVPGYGAEMAQRGSDGLKSAPRSSDFTASSYLPRE